MISDGPASGTPFCSGFEDVSASLSCIQLFRGSFPAVRLGLSGTLVMELGSSRFPNTQNSNRRLLLPTLKKGLPSSVTLLRKLTCPKVSP